MLLSPQLNLKIKKMNEILCRVAKPLVLYIKKYNPDRVEVALRTIQQNYCTHLCKLDEDGTKNIEIADVGAGFGGGFDHTSKLKVMKFKEAMNGQDSNKWKEDIENRHTRMVMNGT